MEMSLENVKAGDTLIQDASSRNIVKVDRTTKTQIVLVGGSKYRKDTGWSVGSSGSSIWHRVTVRIPKEGELEEVRNEKLHARFVNAIDTDTQHKWLKNMSLDQLRRLHTLLAQFKAEACQGCGNIEPERLSECPQCGGQKCDDCDIGDDVECPNCTGDEDVS
jgi:hypothetical protein